MKKANLLILAVFSAFLIISECCPALHLADPNGVELTTEPNAAPQTWSSSFHIDGQITAWIDYREKVNGVYMTYFNDLSHTEYLIDPNAFDAEIAKVEGSNLFYSIRDPDLGKPIIRMADCTNPAAPAIQDIDVPITGESFNDCYITSLDVDNNLLLYATWDYPGYDYIYVIDLNEPNRPSHLIAEYTDGNTYLQSNVSLDGTTCAWSYSTYDSEMGMYYNALAVADISDVNSPVVQTAMLPGGNCQSNMEIWNLNISGDWLVASGYYESNSNVFGIFHFKDPNSANWDIVNLWDESGCYEWEVGQPVIDLPYAAWYVNFYGGGPTTYSSQIFAQSETSPHSLVAGAILLDNGAATASILKTIEDPSTSVYGVQINDGNIVWSEDKYWYEDDMYYYASDLYGGTLVPDCRDWGYSFADLNHDCQVDLSDFAIFAQKWLDCTTPDAPDCIYGDVYSAPNGTWRTLE